MFNHHLRKYVSNRDGVTAVEFALVFPILMTIVFGFFHFGIFFFGTHQAQRASETTARAVRMMDMPTEQEIRDVLDLELSKPIGGSYSKAVRKIDEHGGTFADVRITYEYTMPIPFADKYPMKTETGTRIRLRNLQ